MSVLLPCAAARAFIASSGSVQEVPKNPVLGAGPFALRFRLEPLVETTRITVTMEKLPQEENARSYRLIVVLPGNHWARGVPTLTTESVRPFSLALDRAVFSGELAEEPHVTEVPWQR